MTDFYTAETELTLSHGEFVRVGAVAVSNFLQEVMAKSDENRRYSGTLKDLTALVEANLDNFEAGTGSVEDDVRLVRVPTENFFTNIVPITDDNAASIRLKWEARVEGEAPVSKLVIEDETLIPASVVKIVIYRADTLARDSGRSSDAEWEIVAVLAQPAESVPMHPNTMARNALHQAGGTYREYDNKTWAEAIDFWQRHVYLEKIRVNDPLIAE